MNVHNFLTEFLTKNRCLFQGTFLLFRIKKVINKFLKVSIMAKKQFLLYNIILERSKRLNIDKRTF